MSPTQPPLPPSRGQPPVPRDLWQPIVRELLESTEAAKVMEALQEGRPRQAIMTTLHLSEERYYDLVSEIHEAYRDTVKAYWVYIRLSRSETLHDALTGEDRVIAELLVAASQPPLSTPFPEIPRHLPYPARRLLEVLHALASPREGPRS